MAEDDIESYWEEIRPVREPEPEPRRTIHQHAARFRESFVGTDEQWDLRAIDIQRAGRVNDPRSFTMDEIRGDCEERSLAFMSHALITELGHEPTNREVIRTLQQYVTVPETQEELERIITEPAVPVTLPSSRTPMGGDPSSSEQMRRLENLQQALVALGFPSDSISLGASGDQSIILAFHRSPSVELETTSRRDNVTLTFTHRR
jgi:hypothetical protein